MCVGACHCPSHLTNMSFHTFIFDWKSGCYGNDDDPEAFSQSFVLMPACVCGMLAGLGLPDKTQYQ